jgi:hypothetical protein
MRPPSTFGGQLVLYAACAAAAWFAWPLIKGGFPNSFPQDASIPRPYDEYGYTGDPGRRARWEQGGRGGYSDFYPGPRTERPASPPVARQQMHLDESLQDPIEDRRGERRAPQWDVDAPVADARGLACWDRQERRRVDPAFCSREGRR